MSTAVPNAKRANSGRTRREVPAAPENEALLAAGPNMVWRPQTWKRFKPPYKTPDSCARRTGSSPDRSAAGSSKSCRTPAGRAPAGWTSRTMTGGSPSVTTAMASATRPRIWDTPSATCEAARYSRSLSRLLGPSKAGTRSRYLPYWVPIPALKSADTHLVRAADNSLLRAGPPGDHVNIQIS